jgi:DNA-binding phage protein
MTLHDPAVALLLFRLAPARTLTALAQKVGRGRVDLNNSLSGDGNPTRAMVTKIAMTLGLTITIQPGPSPASSRHPDQR